ncbi:MAG TPA: hypothetical protein VJA21_19760 [Verrucomicrobiae bacterium]
MNTRGPKWAVAILACALLLGSWRMYVLSRQADAALGISDCCVELERFVLAATDPQALALQVQWLQVYYGLNSGKVSDPRLRRLVRRDYEHTMTNAFGALHRLATNNISTNTSPWLADWMKEHEH